MPQQQTHARAERAGDAFRLAPEDAVVDQEHVCPPRGGLLDDRRRRIHRQRNPRDGPVVALDLQTLRAVILNLIYTQIIVQIADQRFSFHRCLLLLRS